MLPVEEIVRDVEDPFVGCEIVLHDLRQRHHSFHVLAAEVDRDVLAAGAPGQLLDGEGLDPRKLILQ